MNNKYEFKYDCDPAIVVAMSREFLWNTHAGWIVGSVLVGALSIAGLVSGSYGGFWSFCLGAVSMYWYWFLQNRRQIQRAAAKIESPWISFVIDENGCTYESPNSHGWIAWSTIGRLRRFRRAIVLERNDGSYPFQIPTHILTAEASGFLVQCIARAGGRTQ